MSEPCTPDLLPQHLADLRKSGLFDESIAAGRFKSVTDPVKVAAALGWNRAGAVARAKALGPCLGLPFPDPAAAGFEYSGYARVRPDKPRARDGRAFKYESPVGQPNRAYFPPAARAALRDPGVPLVVTEGEKKAAKADQDGFPCVGLVGVYGWQKKRDKGPDGAKVGPRVLIPDLAAVAWAGRTVSVVFDSDAADKAGVVWAEFHLAEALAAAGADVRVVRLPPGPDGSKVGLDDYLVANGPDAFRALLATASPAGRPPQANDKPDNPHVLAEGYLFGDRGFGRAAPALRYWRNTFVEWAAGAYRTAPDDDVKARVTEWVRAEFVRLNLIALKAWEAGDKKEERPTVKPVTTKVVSDVMQAVRGLCLLPADVSAPAWINGADGPDPLTLLPVRNGLLDLDAAAAGKADCLLPHCPDFFTFNAAPFEYDPAAPEPKAWFGFLNALWPDDSDAVAALREWFGYLLTPDTRQQKMLFLLGPRRAGKGTIARVLRELVGPLNVAGPTLNSLATNFGLQSLLDKSVAIIDDARLSGRTDTAVVTERLLTITGEGTLTVDRKHKQAVDAKLGVRIVVLSNELPRLGDASGALVGRMVILRFTRTWFNREDHHLFDRLRAELPGILLWAIAGRKSLQARGRFVQPASGNELIDEMEDIASPVGVFVRERCVVEPRARVEVDLLYCEWRRWCDAHGKKEPGTLEVFGRDVRAAVPEIKKVRPRTEDGRVNCYQGIRLRSLTDEQADSGPNVVYGDFGHGGHSGHGDQSQRKAEPQPETGSGGQCGHCDQALQACEKRGCNEPIGDAMPGYGDHRGQHDQPQTGEASSWV